MCQNWWESNGSGRSHFIPTLAAVLESGTFYQTHLQNLANMGRLPRGMQLDTRSSSACVPSWEDLEAGWPHEHHAWGCIPKHSRNRDPWSASDHAAIALGANFLDQHSKMWEKWVPCLSLPGCANVSRFTQLLCMPVSQSYVWMAGLFNFTCPVSTGE